MRQIMCDACGGTLLVESDPRKTFATCTGCGALVDTNAGGPAIPQTRTHDRYSVSPQRSVTRTDPRLENERGTTAILCFLFGILITMLFVGFLIAVEAIFGNTFPDRFLDRGWTPYAAMLLTFWSLAILVSRILLVSRRKRVLGHNYFDINLSLADTAGLEAAIMDLRRQAALLNDTLIGPRLARALERFRAARNIDAAGEALREAGDLAANQSHAEYTPVRVFLWTVPILGFLGTVLGIGTAIGGFTGFLDTAEEVNAIKHALGDVSAGLSVAFDTTMVGLVLSIVIMFAMSAVERMEQTQLQDAEERCIDLLIPRLSMTNPIVPDQAAIAVQIVEEVRVALNRLSMQTDKVTDLPHLTVRPRKQQ